MALSTTFDRIRGDAESAAIVENFPAYWLAVQLSRRLPLSFAYWVGLRVADIFHARDRTGRANVAANLRRIYAFRGVRASDQFVQRRVRKTYQYFGKYLVDFFRYSLASRDELEDRVTVAGMDRLEAVLRRGRGAIIASAHFGNYELGALMLSLSGYSVTTVFRSTGSRRLDRLFDRLRRGRGVSLLPLGQATGGLRAVLRAGGIVALLADRDFSSHTHPFPFFGAPANLPRGPAVLAARTRACIVPAFLVRGVDDHYLMEFDAPIDPESAGGVTELQAALVAAMERTIGAHPHQWFIFDDFWRTGASEPSAGAAV